MNPQDLEKFCRAHPEVEWTNSRRALVQRAEMQLQQTLTDMAPIHAHHLDELVESSLGAFLIEPMQDGRTLMADLRRQIDSREPIADIHITDVNARVEVMSAAGSPFFIINGEDLRIPDDTKRVHIARGSLDEMPVLAEVLGHPDVEVVQMPPNMRSRISNLTRDWVAATGKQLTFGRVRPDYVYTEQEYLRDPDFDAKKELFENQTAKGRKAKDLQLMLDNALNTGVVGHAYYSLDEPISLYRLAESLEMRAGTVARNLPVFDAWMGWEGSEPQPDYVESSLRMLNLRIGKLRKQTAAAAFRDTVIQGLRKKGFEPPEELHFDRLSMWAKLQEIQRDKSIVMENAKRLHPDDFEMAMTYFGINAAPEDMNITYEDLGQRYGGISKARVGQRLERFLELVS